MQNQNNPNYDNVSVTTGAISHIIIPETHAKEKALRSSVIVAVQLLIAMNLYYNNLL